VTFHPGRCLTWWQVRLQAWQLQAQVLPPSACGVACSKSDSRAWRPQEGNEHLPIFIRYTSFAVLAPALVGNLVQPQWWPWLAGIGYLPATITSYQCHSLARRNLRDASALSTVRTAPDPVLQAYGQWSSSMGFLALALLGLALGMRLHMVHDVWVYTASLCAVNVVIMYAVKSVYFGPSVRGSLIRALIAGERWEMSRRVRQ
jgi:hypothetical protein